MRGGHLSFIYFSHISYCFVVVFSFFPFFCFALYLCIFIISIIIIYFFIFYYIIIVVLGTQQTLATNLLFKNNSSCQTFQSLICDLLQWQVHKQRQCSGSLYTREAESKATKTFLSNQGNKEDSYMNNNEGIIHGQ